MLNIFHTNEVDQLDSERYASLYAKWEVVEWLNVFVKTLPEMELCPSAFTDEDRDTARGDGDLLYYYTVEDRDRKPTRTDVTTWKAFLNEMSRHFLGCVVSVARRYPEDYVGLPFHSLIVLGEPTVFFTPNMVRNLAADFRNAHSDGNDDDFFDRAGAVMPKRHLGAIYQKLCAQAFEAERLGEALIIRD